MSIVSKRPVTSAVSFGRAMVGIYRDRNIPFMAGSIAYAAFVSLIPSIVLLFIVASMLGGETLQGYVLETTERYLTPTSQGILATAIEQSTEQVEFSLLALVALLWAVLKVFRTLDTAFSTLYGIDRDPGIVDQITDGLVVVGGMTVAFLATVGVGAVIALASTPVNADVVAAIPGIEYLGITTLLVGLTVVFVPIYYVFPDVDVSVSEIVPGAIVAAIGWTLLQGAFQVYVSTTSTSELYGVVGGVILVITWLYFGAVVVLLGAATNVVLAGRNSRFDYPTDQSSV